MFLAAAYGLVPDPWQELVLRDWLGMDGRGKWSAKRCGLSVPRQNGKNALLEIRELYGMVVLGEKIVHSAHQVKTAQKAFRRLRHFFGRKANDPNAAYPELNALVDEVRNVNGQEAVVLKNGGSTEIVARSKDSGRGFTVDLVILDEAQELTDDSLESLLSINSAAPLGNPQHIYTGTPPGPRANGEVFTRNRENALARKTRTACWHEWSCDVGVDLDDREAWAYSNPSYRLPRSGALQPSVCVEEREQLSDDGFMRERLGMWSRAAGQWVIPQQFWYEAGDLGSVAVDRLALGVEVGPDAGWASVAVAGLREDGDWHIELWERQDGAAWVVSFVGSLLERNPDVRCVVTDAGSPSSSLTEEFGRAKISLVHPKVAELGTACTNLMNGIVVGGVHHTKQAQMDAAVAAAGKRRLGDTGMWVWSRSTASADITPVQAATLALFGAQSENVRRPVRRRTSERRAVLL